SATPSARRPGPGGSPSTWPCWPRTRRSTRRADPVPERPVPEPPVPERAVILVTGIQAAGKSTVAQLLAERLPRSGHLRGDVFRKMIVSGRVGMTPDAPAEAVRQLRLRHRLTAVAADTYFEAGFTVVAQDVILGEHLAGLVAAVRGRPLLVVVLAPQPGAIAA